MGLFRKQPAAQEEEPAPLEVHERSVAPYDFESKPDELVEAAARGASSEWTRPLVRTSAVPISVPWSENAPTSPGLYWWQPADQPGAPDPLLAVVIDFGGRMCLRRGGGDASTYISVSSLARRWSGPLPLPEGIRLERLETDAARPWRCS